MNPALPGFYGLLGQHRHSFPERTAVVHAGRRIGYAELFERAGRLARMLAGHGVRAGDRVLWLGQNSHVLVELLAACDRLGAMFCCANWRQSADELEFVLRDFDARVVLWQRGEIDQVIEGARSRGRDIDGRWISVDDEGVADHETHPGHAPELSGEHEDPTSNATAPLLALYTAAFEGRPNAAMLSAHGLYLQAMVHAHALEITHRSVALVSSPLFHILGWLDLLPALLQGGTVVIARRADAEDLLFLLASERVTTGTIHPPTAAAIATLNRDRKLDLSAFRSALRMPGWADMTTPGPGIGGYGQTEVAGPVVIGAYAGKGRTPFCGRTSPIAEVRIVDESGTDVAPGETGEIHVRAAACLGYWNRPELNAARWAAHGWWRTRDLGSRDADGTISFVGAKTRFVKTGGENVYPAEVETVLASHPAVQRAAIIGTPDDQWGQLVTAVIVRLPEAAVTAEELSAHVRARLAAYKAPRVVHFADALPLVPVGGAIDYLELDRRFGGGGYPGQGVRTATTIGAGAA